MISNTRALAIGGVLTIASASMSVFAQEASLFDKLPQDVIAAVGIKDLPAIKTKMGESRFNAAFQSSEMEPMRVTMLDAYTEMKKEFMEETSLDMEKIFEFAKGDVTVALLEIMDGEPYGSSKPLASAMAVIEIDPNERDSIQNDLNVAFDELPEDAEKGTYDFQGIEVRTIKFENKSTYEEYEWQTGETIEVIEVDPVFIEYGFHDNKLFIGEGPSKPAAKILNALTNEGESKLGEHAGVLKLNQNYEASGDVKIWANIPGLIESIKTITEDEADSAQIFKFLDASGFSDIEGAGLQFSLIGSGLLSEFGMLMPAQRKGIVEALYTGNKLELNSASIVPADAYKYSAFQLDLGRIWDATVAILAAEMPEAKAQLDMGLSFVNAQIQTDLVENVIRKIKGEHFYYQTRDPKGAEKAKEVSEQYGFDVPESLETSFQIAAVDQEAFHATMSSIIDIQINSGSFPMEKAEYQGVTIFEPIVDPNTPAGFGFEPSVGLTKNSISVAANREVMNELIRQTQSTEENRGLAGNAEYQSVLEGMDREWLAHFDYTSPDMMIFSMEQALNALAMVTEDVEIPDAEDLPDEAWYKTYFGSIISVGYLKPDLYYSNSIWYTVE